MIQIDRILNRMNEVIDNPNKEIRSFKDRTGQKAIGCGPYFTAPELVHAAGMLPVGVWGGKTEISEAFRYYPTFYCSLILTTMELGLKGVYRELSGIIVSVICDGLKNLEENWKYAIPEVEMIGIVYPNNRKLEVAGRYLKEELKNVKDVLERISGNRITEYGLNHSIQVYNHHRKIMRDFSEIACQHLDVITPIIRHSIMKSVYFMTIEEHTELVEDLINELNQRSAFDYPGTKIILTGIMVDSPEILKMLEDNHIAVVGDDLLHESMFYNTDVPDGIDPYLRLAGVWSLMEGCSILYDPQKKRGPMLVELAKKRKADGIMICIIKFCEVEEFDYPILEKDLRKANIPVLYFEIEQHASNDQQAGTRIQAFKEMLENR